PKGHGNRGKSGSMLATLREPGLRRVLVISSIAQVGFDSFASFMPVYAHAAGLSASTIGSALSIFAIASLAPRLGMARLTAKIGGEKGLIVAFAFGVAAYVLLPFFNSPAALFSISVLFGIFIGMSMPTIMV